MTNLNIIKRTIYNDLKRINLKLMNELKEKILFNQENDIAVLCTENDTKIVEECNKIYHKYTSKGVHIPTCITLNNCLGYNRNGIITNGDIIKINFGIFIDDVSNVIGETITFDKSDPIVKFLNNVPKCLSKLPVDISDDIKFKLEEYCTLHADNCWFVENTISYNLDKSKYIILNHSLKYDQEDNLVSEPNVCFELLEGEIYTINLDIIATSERCLSYTTNDSSIYQFNGEYTNLKLNNSREFCTMAKTRHLLNAFDASEYLQKPKYRMGIKDCVAKGILDVFQNKTNKEKYNIYHKQFNIIIKGSGDLKQVCLM